MKSRLTILILSLVASGAHAAPCDLIRT